MQILPSKLLTTNIMITVQENLQNSTCYPTSISFIPYEKMPISQVTQKSNNLKHLTAVLYHVFPVLRTSVYYIVNATYSSKISNIVTGWILLYRLKVCSITEPYDLPYSIETKYIYVFIFIQTTLQYDRDQLWCNSSLL